MDENKMITVMGYARTNNLSGLWEEIFKSVDTDILAKIVQDIAASEGWGRERLATALAAVLLTRVEQQNEQIQELLAMRLSPSPILVPKDQIVYLPSIENRGPGC